MPAEEIPYTFGEWANEPVIQDQVIAYMEQIAAPMLLREIYHPLRLPKVSVNRVLGRLHAKGIVSRYKIPVVGHRPGRRTETAPRDGATRRLYLYSFADGYDE